MIDDQLSWMLNRFLLQNEYAPLCFLCTFVHSVVKNKFTAKHAKFFAQKMIFNGTRITRIACGERR